MQNKPHHKHQIHIWKTLSPLVPQNMERQEGMGWKYKETEMREPPYHFCADLKRSGALCKHLVHQLDPMHQRAQGHTGTGWRLPLTATVNFQHNQFMCSSIITICVLHEEDSPEEQNSAGCSSSPWATPGAKGRRRKRRRRKRGRSDVKEMDERGEGGEGWRFGGRGVGVTMGGRGEGQQLWWWRKVSEDWGEIKVVESSWGGGGKGSKAPSRMESWVSAWLTQLSDGGYVEGKMWIKCVDVCAQDEENSPLDHWQRIFHSPWLKNMKP